MTILILSLAVAYILVVWFKTSALHSYAIYFNFDGHLKFPEYMEHLTQGEYLSYPEWLSMAYPGFFTSLVSCPTCLSFWISLLFTSIFSTFSFLTVFAVAFTGLCFYHLYNRLVISSHDKQ